MKKNDLTNLLKGIILCFYIIALIVLIYGLIWGRFDFTLTLSSWVAILLILHSVWYDIFSD